MAEDKCERCVHLEYDEEYEQYYCNIDLDEDEMSKFIQGTYHDCPYFDGDDEYKIVRKQM